MSKIYENDEVIPIGTTFKSKCDSRGTTIRVYTVVEIYRTYNSAKELVMIRYDTKDKKGNSGICGIKHDNLKSHIKIENNFNN